MDITSINNIASVAAAQTAQIQTPTINPQQRELIQAVKAVDVAALFGSDKELTFVMDRHSRRAVVRIVDRSTGDVLQQIPAEFVLRMAEEQARS
jgi:flagellar protein FlaG